MRCSTHSSSLEETKLYKRLKGSKFSCSNQDLIEHLTGLVEKYYREAVRYLDEVQEIFKEYTLHDERHVLNVIDIMGAIIPRNTLEQLNCLEGTLLLLSACFHDIGMYASEQELRALKDSQEFKRSLYEFAQYESKLSELKRQKQDESMVIDKKNIDKEIDLLTEIHLVNFLRRSHGERSFAFLNKMYGENDDFKIDRVSIVPSLARICESHARSIEKTGLKQERLISELQVNENYLGIVLRLADILDFDRTRTPPELYATIHSSRSLDEWNKHLSVLGWRITHEIVKFDCECEQPLHQNLIYRFLDEIEMEIVKCTYICKNFSKDFSKYKLKLPLKIDRSEIKPKDDKYIYKDLFLRFNKKQVLDLFMGLKIYNSPSLCVRELAQNSIDALSLREAVYQYHEQSRPKLEIEFKHRLDEEGNEIISCKDTGIGMDLEDIEHYLLTSGNSYYDSFDFTQWKTRFEEKNIKCNTIAQFGIGFFSCFMLGDKITVYTRKYIDPYERLGTPYVIEIDGSLNIISISKGKKDQFGGTMIEIVKKEKELYFYKERDKVRLHEVLTDYFVKVKYPIKIDVSVPNIEVSDTLNPGFHINTIPMEHLWKHIKTYRYDLSRINENIEGEIRTSFFTNGDGKILLNDSEELKEILQSYQELPVSSFLKKEYTGTICIDGIVVLGDLKDHDYDHIRKTKTFVFPNTALTLNVSGKLYLPLNIDRTALNPGGDPKWQQLKSLVVSAYHKLWDILIEKEKIDPETLWSLFDYYKVNLSKLSIKTIKQLKFAIINKKTKELKWCELEDHKEVEERRRNAEDHHYYWHYKNEGRYIRGFSNDIFAFLKFLKFHFDGSDGLPKVTINLDEAPEVFQSFKKAFFLFKFNKKSILTIQRGFLSSWNPYSSFEFNSDHDICKIATQTTYKYNTEMNMVEIFCRAIMDVFSGSGPYFYIIESKSPTSDMKYVATLYKKLKEQGEWLDNIVPFEVFIYKIGIVEINDEMLRSWL